MENKLICLAGGEERRSSFDTKTGRELGGRLVGEGNGIAPRP